MIKRYKLTLEYNGTPYCGWQKQLGQKSVEQTLMDALFKLTQHTLDVVGAGRTDSGVHATGQVAHVDVPIRYEATTLLQALNCHLKEEPISLLKVEAVDPDFHARFSAIKRTYRYVILNRKSPPTFQKNIVWHVYRPLDVDAMREAGSFLLGSHDFSSFRAAECQASSPFKTLDRFDVTQESDLIFCDVEARSFLHHQVRNMVGTLKLVGEGKLSPRDIPRILAAKERAAAGPTAPPQGLFLTGVFYGAK